MANTVFQLRRNTVSGTRPTTSTVSPGELAINTTDGILFSANATTVFEVGSNNTTVAIGNSTFRSTINSSSFSIANTVAVTANGSTGTSGQVLTSNGTGVYWGAGGGTTGGLVSRQDWTANGTQNTFTFTGGYNSNALSVYLNGVLAANSEVTASNGNTFTFTTTPPSNSIVTAVGISSLYANGVSIIVNQQTTANGTANSFAVTGGYIPNQILVFLNGVKQNPANAVTITSGSNVGFASTPPNGAVIDIYGYQSAAVLNSNSISVGAVSIGSNSITFGNSVALVANSSNGTAGQVLTSNGTGVYWSTVSGVNTAAQYSWTNTHAFSSNLTVNAASFFVQNATTISTINTTGIYVGNTTTNVVIANTVSSFGGNVSITGVANVTGNVTLGSSAFFVGNGVYLTTVNATSVSTGTLPMARLGANVVNTSAAFTITGVSTHNANLFVNAATLSVGNATSVVTVNTTSFTIPNAVAVSANGSNGTAGQVLTSNGTGIYWAAAAAGVNTAAQYSWTNTHVFSSNLTVNAASLFVQNATTISTVNTTGIYVGNTTTNVIIANTTSTFGGNVVITGTANSANLNTTTNVATIGTASYFVANGNFGVGTTTPIAKIQSSADIASPFFIAPTTITANYTIPTNYNAFTPGPVAVNTSVTVTVPSGSTWTIV